MERLPQELIEKVIDHVDYVDLRACSLVGRRWVARSRWRVLGSGYCSFIDRRQLKSSPWRTRLLTTGLSTFAQCIHTLTLGSTAVQAWAGLFRNTDVVLPHLESLIITNAQLGLDDVAVLKRNFGNTLLSLSLNRVSIKPKEFYPILSSFPNLDNLSITRLNLPHLPFGNIPTCPRTQGKLTLVGVETHDTCVPLLLRLPVWFRTLYFDDTVEVGKVHPLVRACSSTLTTLEIRDDVPRKDGHEPPLASEHYPELRTICFTLAAFVKPRDYVALVLSSITSAPKLSEVSFIFTRTELGRDLVIAMSLAGWGSVDDQLYRLAQQATRGVTASFDFLMRPGWTPRRDGKSFMWGFRRLGVVKLRSSGKDVVTYYPRAH